MPLTIGYQGTETTIDDDASALVGSDVEATIRIVRPGISRKHLIISHDGTGWKLQDAGSRNGTFADGDRVQVRSFDGPITLHLGHPTDGEVLSLVPSGGATTETEDTDFSLPDTAQDPIPVAAGSAVTERAAAPTRVQPSISSSSDVELAQLTAAIRDQISAIKGLTWSVWAMIAVTAALIVLTLFVGILAN